MRRLRGKRFGWPRSELSARCQNVNSVNTRRGAAYCSAIRPPGQGVTVSEKRSLKVAIIGAGMSGLCIAAKLQDAGIETFTIFEKADEVGGTWRDNTYPGLSCDVPSRFYTYSFRPNPAWSRLMSPGPEIHSYFRQVATERGIRPHIRFGTDVTSARYREGQWWVGTADGEEAFDVLITATGFLRVPRYPDIPGLDSFAGPMFHSSRWDHSVTLPDKRIGLIGTGSTGVQITAELGGKVNGLKIFQRTPQWVFPTPNLRYSRFTKTALQRWATLNKLGYRFWQTYIEHGFGRATVEQCWQRRAMAAMCRWNLRLSVRDLDLLVLATGFDARAYVRPMEIVGEHGLKLDEAWEDGPHAYRSIAVPGFPNLFMLMGPHSPIGNQSLVIVAEDQADYAMWWINQIRDGSVVAAAPTEAATKDYNESMKAAMPQTVWVTGCKSWYLGKDGLPELFPWTPRRHRELLATPQTDDFVIRTA